MRDLLKKNDWKVLIEKWDTLLESQFSILNREAIDHGILSENVFSVKRTGCSSQQIQLAEARLGVSLPNSFREFLLHTNGANTLERPLLMLSANELDWYKNVEPKKNIEIWEQDSVSASDEKYFVYGSTQDCVHMRPEYLKHCLAISTTFDGDIYLLNPCIKTDDGEWEAWYLGFKNPGAVRFRTFWELMLERLSKVENYLER